MNIQTITSLYEESHCLNHTAMRIKGDIKVNKALDNAVERESNQLRKKSIIVQAQKTHEKAMHLHTHEGQMPTFPDAHWDKQKKKMINDIKSTVKKTVRAEHSEAHASHLHGLLKQGDLLSITLQKQQDATWQ